MTLLAFIFESAPSAGNFSGRALVLYALVVICAFLALTWKAEIGIYILTLLLPLQTTRYHLHAFPLGANIVDILLACSLLGLWMRPNKLKEPHPFVLRFVIALAIFYYISLWRGAFFLGTPLPFWFKDARLVDYKNFMVLPLLAYTTYRIIRTRQQVAIVIFLACVSSLLVDYSYLKSSLGRDFTHYSEEARDAGPLGYAGENGLASYVVEITAFMIPMLALKRRWLAVPVSFLLAANFCCILYSYSREAYLAIALALLFLAVAKFRWLLIPLLAVAFTWQAVMPVAVQERINMSYAQKDSGEAAQLDASAQERVMLWTDALTIFHENPVVGTGFLTYANMNRVGSYKDTHNFYLKMLVETGIVGLALFIAQLFLFCRQGFKLYLSKSSHFLSLIGLGFAALILAAAVVNIFGDRWMFTQVDSNLWIFLGCVMAAPAMTQQTATEESESVLAGVQTSLPPPRFVRVKSASLPGDRAHATPYVLASPKLTRDGL
jgi:putative inorganic carbon (hco3(-)) transporter